MWDCYIKINVKRNVFMKNTSKTERCQKRAKKGKITNETKNNTHILLSTEDEWGTKKILFVSLAYRLWNRSLYLHIHFIWFLVFYHFIWTVVRQQHATEKWSEYKCLAENARNLVRQNGIKAHRNINRAMNLFFLVGVSCNLLKTMDVTLTMRLMVFVVWFTGTERK